jgi:hypothetical protein
VCARNPPRIAPVAATAARINHALRLKPLTKGARKKKPNNRTSARGQPAWGGFACARFSSEVEDSGGLSSFTLTPVEEVINFYTGYYGMSIILPWVPGKIPIQMSIHDEASVPLKVIKKASSDLLANDPVCGSADRKLIAPPCMVRAETGGIRTPL